MASRTAEQSELQVSEDTDPTNSCPRNVYMHKLYCNSILQQSEFRRFAAKYYHLFLLKMVSVTFAALDVSF